MGKWQVTSTHLLCDLEIVSPFIFSLPLLPPPLSSSLSFLSSFSLHPPSVSLSFLPSFSYLLSPPLSPTTPLSPCTAIDDDVDKKMIHRQRSAVVFDPKVEERKVHMRVRVCACMDACVCVCACIDNAGGPSATAWIFMGPHSILRFVPSAQNSSLFLFSSSLPRARSLVTPPPTPRSCTRRQCSGGHQEER